MSTLEWRSCLVVFYPSGKVVIGKALHSQSVPVGRTRKNKLPKKTAPIRGIICLQDGTFTVRVVADTEEEAISKAREEITEAGYVVPQEVA